MQFRSQGGPLRVGRYDQPVHAWGVTARVALSDAPRADQRVSTTTQHEFLQIANPFEVACLTCREYTLPQPLYPLFLITPIDAIPVQRAFWSVHHHLALRAAADVGHNNGWLR